MARHECVYFPNCHFSVSGYIYSLWLTTSSFITRSIGVLLLSISVCILQFDQFVFSLRGNFTYKPTGISFNSHANFRLSALHLSFSVIFCFLACGNNTLASVDSCQEREDDIKSVAASWLKTSTSFAWQNLIANSGCNCHQQGDFVFDKCTLLMKTQAQLKACSPALHPSSTAAKTDTASCSYMLLPSLTKFNTGCVDWLCTACERWWLSNELADFYFNYKTAGH